VAASRLDVDAYDTRRLLVRLRYFAETADRCGGPAVREAFARLDEVTGWRERTGGGGDDHGECGEDGDGDAVRSGEGDGEDEPF
jgi:hypothetical protein